MDCKDERSNPNGASKRRKKRRSYWAVFSCFGGGSDMPYDDDAMKGSRAKSLAVVPVETSGGGESDRRSTDEGTIVGKKERKKELNWHKSFKDKSKGTNAPAKSQPTQQITTVYHVASNLKSQTELAPLYRMPDPVQADTQTRTSHSGSSEPGSPPAPRKNYEKTSKENGYGPSMGLCVLTIALALMLLGGLTLCVICMCMCFSVFYMLRPRKVPELDGTTEGENITEEVDVSSEEYKRKVVLRGFLERNKRKSLRETKKGDGV